jgi:hypothetical protein
MVGSSKATKTMGIEKTQSFHRFQSLPFPQTTGILFTPYFFFPDSLYLSMLCICF